MTENKHIGSSFDDFLREEGMGDLLEGESHVKNLICYVTNCEIKSGSNDVNDDLLDLIKKALAEQFWNGERFACVGCRRDAKNKRVGYIGHSCSRMGMLR